jgi:hypothetical protein
MLLSCRYNEPEDREESDSSESLSSNEDWSEHSSDDDVGLRERRHTTVLVIFAAFAVLLLI